MFPCCRQRDAGAWSGSRARAQDAAQKTQELHEALQSVGEKNTQVIAALSERMLPDGSAAQGVDAPGTSGLQMNGDVEQEGVMGTSTDDVEAAVAGAAQGPTWQGNLQVLQQEMEKMHRAIRDSSAQIDRLQLANAEVCTEKEDLEEVVPLCLVFSACAGRWRTRSTTRTHTQHVRSLWGNPLLPRRQECAPDLRWRPG